MKVQCKCGNVITDNTDNLNYKAEFTKDQDIEKRLEAFDVMSDFIDAINNNKRDEWIISFYRSNELVTLNNSAILCDIFLKYDHTHSFYQCNVCGRLLVPSANHEYSFFYPEDNNNKNILSSKP